MAVKQIRKPHPPGPPEIRLLQHFRGNIIHMSIVPMGGLLSETRLTKQMGVVRIASAVVRPRRLGPAETKGVEKEKDREYREKDDTGENVDGLNKLKHWVTSQEKPYGVLPMLQPNSYLVCRLVKIAHILCIY